MNQYILIYIWVLLLGLFATRQQYSVIDNDEIIEVKPSKIYCIMLVLPLIISATFRTSFGDQGYKMAFIEHRHTESLSQLIEFVNTNPKGPGYSIIQYLGNVLFDSNAELFFFAVASFQMFALVRLYRKYSVGVWSAVFIFVASTDYLSWMQNGIRQFLAVSIILLFSDYIFEKKLIKMCFIILIASMVHTSALIMLPIVFIVQGEAFNRKTLLLIAGTLLLIFAIDRFVPIADLMLSDTEYAGVITDWKQSGNHGVSILRVLVGSIPAILSIMSIRTIKQSNDSVIKISCNMGIISALLYIAGGLTSGIFAGRLPVYVSLYSYGILLPWLLKNAFSREMKVLLYVIMIFSYTVFYWVQTHLVWGII